MELGLFLQIDGKRIVVPSIYTSSLQSPPSLVSLARSSRKTAPSAALPHRQAPNAAARSHRSAAAAGLRSEAPTHPRRWKCSSRPVFAEKNASRFFVVSEFPVMRLFCLSRACLGIDQGTDQAFFHLNQGFHLHAKACS
jgi:hypothetical protein